MLRNTGMGWGSDFTQSECQVPWQMPGTHHERSLGPLLGWDIIQRKRLLNATTILAAGVLSVKQADKHSA